MIHYGKTTGGDLQIIINEEHVDSVRRLILSASLQERREFYGLKDYIEKNFKNNPKH